MKKFTLNKNSGHYKFLANWDSQSIPDDICRYVRKLISTIIIFIMAGVGIAMAFHFFVIVPLQFLFVGFVFDVWGTWFATADGLEGTMVGVWIIFGLCFASYCGFHQIEVYYRRLNRREFTKPEKPEKDPSMITLWYRSFKDKTCVKLEFKDL
tara:strand:+ start:6090 stop:6548 length:459 start_codon:yes stop_codon:yes gene_type:complete